MCAGIVRRVGLLVMSGATAVSGGTGTPNLVIVTAGTVDLNGITVEFMPVALHCYTIARNLLRGS